MKKTDNIGNTVSPFEAREILSALEAIHPDAAPALNFTSAYELMVAVVLSAQCTDKRVNIVTGELFSLADNPCDMVRLGEKRLAEIVTPCGLGASKARHIINASQRIIDVYGGEVPSGLQELMSLEGVGIKSASVIRSVWFGIPAIAVDTHVFRVANRLGLAKASTPEATQKQLMELLDEDKWSHAHHLLIFHGRRICSARKPQCGICPLKDKCQWQKSNNT
ncbi:MAG: endonuclease III [Clostridiales bacterium]|nr:endonuclease III [Clostridiales bacterium]